ncbi:hypothetical protein M9H77_02074 [Catharanthus roseus]|uniref:Uncharacterized protein n=1 Tax=Catharanthus roseus TaxID=4058 RepID=A0ACC0C7N5_CATRO|nr:hypothetical protein M9H77_02074 [Catharanthus roseus]
MKFGFHLICSDTTNVNSSKLDWESISSKDLLSYERNFEVVLDPKLKMSLVEFYYDAIYGSDTYLYIERVKNVFQDLYIEYGGQVRERVVDETDKYIIVVTTTDWIELLTKKLYEEKKVTKVKQKDKTRKKIKFSLAGHSRTRFSNKHYFKKATGLDYHDPTGAGLSILRIGPSQRAVLESGQPKFTMDLAILATSPNSSSNL